MNAEAKDGADNDPDVPTPTYDQERPLIRKKEVERILDATRAVETPTAVFTGGQPGAGKSRSIVDPMREQYADKGGIGVIDPDDIRPLFAQAQKEMATRSEFTNEAYAASGTVAYEIGQDVSKHQRNFLRDGTLGDLRYTQQEMGDLKSRDYRVEVHIAAVYQGLSFARTVVRAEEAREESKTGFGRGVGREFHDSTVAGVAASTGVLWNQGTVDRLVLYEGDGKPFFDGVRENGRWVDPSGKPHTGNPKEQVEDRQRNPRPRDLVDAAATWLAARGLVEDPSRKTPAPMELVAAVSKETGLALDRVGASDPAKALAAGNKPLREALESHRDRPLQAAAEAWRRDPAKAVKHWPEHTAAFALAERAAQACAAAQPGQAKAAREHLADKLARGQVKAEPEKTRPAERVVSPPARKRDEPER